MTTIIEGIGPAGVERQATALRMLLRLLPQEAIGIACAILRKAAHENPDMLRRVLNEPVIKEGFCGEATIVTLARIARS